MSSPAMIGDATSLGACLVIVVVATITDVMWRRIPNFLTIGGIVLGIVLHAALGFVDDGDTASGALRGAGRALVGVGVCGALPLISFIRREMGGGDVKLFGAIGALCGPLLGMNVQAFTFAFAILILLPWRLIRQRTLKKLRPVIMAPSILVGFALAIGRHVLAAQSSGMGFHT